MFLLILEIFNFIYAESQEEMRTPSIVYLKPENWVLLKLCISPKKLIQIK